MSRFVDAAVVFSLLAVLTIAGPTLAQERVSERHEGDPIAIEDITIIDVADGTETPGQTVVVRYGKIAYIKPAAEFDTPGWMTVVDGSRSFLIPGLWDAHVHLSFWDEPDGEKPIWYF